jgi:ABC-type multidrug transport system ATPase subunit
MMMIPHSAATLRQVKKRVAELIHILGLLSKADVRVNELSHGEKKRVSIGMV